MRLLLTSNPNLHIPPECGFFVWWEEKFSNLGKSGSKFDADTFLDCIFESKKFEFWNLDRKEAKDRILKEPSKNYADLCKVLYRLHAEHAGKPDALIGDKNNFHTAHVDDLDRLCPDCRFIHIVRDGRDVATSYLALSNKTPTSAYYPRLPGTIDEIAHEWAQNVGSGLIIAMR